MRTDKQLIDSFEDNIIQRGVMYTLISDQAHIKISETVLEFLRTNIIGNWNSETHQQQKNHTKGKHRYIQKN